MKGLGAQGTLFSSLLGTYCQAIVQGAEIQLQVGAVTIQHGSELEQDLPSLLVMKWAWGTGVPAEPLGLHEDRSRTGDGRPRAESSCPLSLTHIPERFPSPPRFLESAVGSS